MIEKISYSDWAAPIVPVVQADGSICICTDYKATVNPVLQVDQFPLPKQEDLLQSSLVEEDSPNLIYHVYQQVLLDPESRKYVTINTHKRLTAFPLELHLQYSNESW